MQQWVLGLAVFLGWALCAQPQAATVYNFGARDDNPSPADPSADKTRITFKPAPGSSGGAVVVRGYSDGIAGVPALSLFSPAATEQVFAPGTIQHLRYGLGVCNATESRSSCPEPSYFVDNAGTEGEDWLFFSFDDIVEFKSITLATRATTDTDYDVSYWYGEMSEKQLAAGLEGESFESLVFKESKGYADVEDKLAFTLGGAGNFLLIGARQFGKDLVGGDGLSDYVLVRSLSVDIAAVPAPTSIVLFASGLVLLAGLRIRRMA